MNSAPVRRTSRIGLYWYLWLTVVAVVLLLRFTFFRNAKPNQLFVLATTYGLGTWLPIMAINVIESRKLFRYLKLHHREKWEWLTYVPGFGPGFNNGFRSLPWLYSKDDLGDPIVAELKRNQTRFIGFVLTVFFSYIIIMPLLLGV